MIQQAGITFSVTVILCTLQDTGVGMNQQDLVDNLGTIARSGSKVTAVEFVHSGFSFNGFI